MFTLEKTVTEKRPNQLLLLLIGIGLAIGSLFISSCSNDEGPEVDSGVPNIPPAGSPHLLLSDYNLFTGDLKDLNPINRLIPYDLNTPLFSDYAKKIRLVYVPEDGKIDASDPNGLVFPEGAILVKNFYYNEDDRSPETGRTLIETRLLIRYQESWIPNTYVWSSDQTEARLLRTGESKPFSWTNVEGVLRNVTYKIPSVNDCRTCHNKSGSIQPIGPKIRNLNKQYHYNDGPSNQLVKWNAAGFFGEEQDPHQLPVLPVWNDTETGSLNFRARAYLDVNCASCHNVSGSARNSGLFLTYEEDDPQRIGVCKIPVAAGFLGEGLKYDIDPGNPDQSILLHRMNSTDPNIRMPELGRTLIHEDAVELIREWIQRMDLAPCE